MGVMALPSLKGYYIVALLRPIVCWCNPSYTATWIQIELSPFSEVLVQAIIADDNLLIIQISKEYSLITTTLQICHSNLKKCELK